MTHQTAEQIAEEAKQRLGGKLLGCQVPSPRRIYIEVAPKDLRETALYLWGEKECRFNTASGLQTPTGFEVLYHFSFDELGIVLSVRVKTGEKENPTLPSVARDIKAFDFIERELYDLLGIRFEGRTDHKPLLRSEDWPEDFFPMRRTEERAELDCNAKETDR